MAHSHPKLDTIPPEIRLKIWRYLFESTSIYVCAHFGPSSWNRKTEDNVSAIERLLRRRGGDPESAEALRVALWSSTSYTIVSHKQIKQDLVGDEVELRHNDISVGPPAICYESRKFANEARPAFWEFAQVRLCFRPLKDKISLRASTSFVEVPNQEDFANIKKISVCPRSLERWNEFSDTFALHDEIARDRSSTLFLNSLRPFTCLQALFIQDDWMRWDSTEYGPIEAADDETIAKICTERVQCDQDVKAVFEMQRNFKLLVSAQSWSVSSQQPRISYPLLVDLDNKKLMRDDVNPFLGKWVMSRKASQQYHREQSGHSLPTLPPVFHTMSSDAL